MQNRTLSDMLGIKDVCRFNDTHDTDTTAVSNAAMQVWSMRQKSTYKVPTRNIALSDHFCLMGS